MAFFIYQRKTLHSGIFELLHYYNGGQGELNETDYPGFKDSDLKFWLDIYEANPELAHNCATIIFCASDFSIIANDIDIVRSQCGIPAEPPFDYFEETCQKIVDYNALVYVVLCKSGISNTSTPSGFDVKISDLSKGFRVPKIALVPENENVENDISTKFIIDTLPGEEISSFSQVINQGFITPKGFLKTSNADIYYNYHHKSISLDKRILSNVTHEIDDWDAEQTIYIEKTDSINSFLLAYEDSLTSWTNSLVSDSLLTIEHLSKTTSELFIAGLYQGELSYDSTILNNAATSAAFLMKTSFDGTLNDIHLLENIHKDEVLFSENRDGEIIIAGRYHDNWIKLNGTIIPMNNNEGYFVLSIDPDNQLNFITNINADNTFELIDLSHADDRLRSALTFSGIGNITLNGNAIFSATQKHLVTLIINEDGTLKWTLPLESANINSAKFDMLFAKDEALMLGLTYSNSINVLTDTLMSEGGYDIALLKLDTVGNLQWTKTFGTPDEENVAHLLYDNGVLFFGGEFSGPTSERTIGGYRFVNLTSLDQRAYISYILDDNATVAIAEKINKQDQKGLVEDRFSDSKTNTFSVSPNPFNQQINIDVHNDRIGRVEISNTIGQVIHVHHISNPGHYVLDMSSNVDGLFIVTAFDREGKFVALKKLIKSRTK